MKIVITFLLLALSYSNIAQNKETLIPYKKGKLWGFSDIKGQIKINPIYDKVELFNRLNMASVHKDKLSGFINNFGEIVLPIEFDKCSFLSSSLIRVKKGNVYGAYDLQGNVLLNLEFNSIYQLYKTNIIRFNFNGKIGIYELIDNQPKLIIDAEYETIEYIKQNKTFLCVNGGIHSELDQNGKLIKKMTIAEFEAKNEEEEIMVEGIFDSSFGDNNQLKYPQFISIKDKKKRGLIIKRKTFNAYIPNQIKTDTIPAKYDSINPEHYFSNCFVVQVKNKWGAVNSNGNIIIDIKYSEIDIKSMSFQNHHTKPFEQIFIIKKKDKWGVIGNTSRFQKSDQKNIELIPFKYDEISQSFDHSFFIVKSNDKYGFINGSDLKLISEIKYSQPNGHNITINGFILYAIIDEFGETVYVGQNGVSFFE